MKKIPENLEDKKAAIKRASENIKYSYNLLYSNRTQANLLFNDVLHGLYDQGFQDGIKQFKKMLEKEFKQILN